MKSAAHRTADCRAIYRHLCENLDADLDSPKCLELRLHVDNCKHCTAYLDSLKKTVRLYREHAVPPVSMPVQKKLLAAIANQAKKTPRRPSGRS